jgi:hypothetical protein
MTGRGRRERFDLRNITCTDDILSVVMETSPSIEAVRKDSDSPAGRRPADARWLWAASVHSRRRERAPVGANQVYFGHEPRAPK